MYTTMYSCHLNKMNLTILLLVVLKPVIKITPKLRFVRFTAIYIRIV